MTLLLAALLRALAPEGATITVTVNCDRPGHPIARQATSQEHPLPRHALLQEELDTYLSGLHPIPEVVVIQVPDTLPTACVGVTLAGKDFASRDVDATSHFMALSDTQLLAWVAGRHHRDECTQTLARDLDKDARDLDYSLRDVIAFALSTRPHLADALNRAWKDAAVPA